MIRIGINGFGRIGRTLFRLLHNHPEIEVVAINDPAETATMAHLLTYDSIHGIFQAAVDYNERYLIVNEKKIPFYHENKIENIPWNKAKAEFIIEASGKFKSYDSLIKHLANGAVKVILTTPAECDQIKTVVLGVNEHILDGSEPIVSNASCTTNNAAPMLQVIKTICNIEQAYITTVHSYTTDQSLHDQPHRDLRRARAAAQSIVPTTTGAAKALTKIFPEMTGNLGGSGIRVPVPDGSLTDITAYVNREVTIEEINAAFKKAANESLAGILLYTADPIVSVDVLGNRHSCVFDSQLTSALGKMVKVVGWYDNEVGYSSRIIDLIIHLVKN